MCAHREGAAPPPATRALGGTRPPRARSPTPLPVALEGERKDSLLHWGMHHAVPDNAVSLRLNLTHGDAGLSKMEKISESQNVKTNPQVRKGSGKRMQSLKMATLPQEALSSVLGVGLPGSVGQQPQIR